MKPRRIAWGARVDADFLAKAIRIAYEIGADPSDFMAAMAFETGGTFSPSIVNKQSGATGLIQFMPSTARALGTTTELLALMDAVEQLDWVKKYFVQNGYAGRIGTLPDLYMAILWPKAIGKPADYVLIEDDGGKAYIQNKGLDLNKDGNITKAEATSLVRKRLEDGLLPQNVSTQEAQTTLEEVTTMEPSAVASGIGGIVSMLNPAAGILFSAFSPLIKQKIAEQVDKHAGTQGVGAAIAESLSQAILTQAKQDTGKTDDLEAVAVARQNIAMIEAAQTAAVASMEERLKQLAPVLEKSVEFDKVKWQAELEGRNAATDRIIKERTAGVWDMTKTVVLLAGVMIMVLIFALLGALVYQATTGQRTIDSGLLGIAGPILMVAVTAWLAIIAFRFDGTKEGSEQTKALTGIMRQDSENRSGS